ncbi:MAG: Uma2 family endonuclease [Clostridiales bacterium]|jgi:Uma2 family endonuclease|nr:Uma2 family endonuclease [Clostridiales bacterium]
MSEIHSLEEFARDEMIDGIVYDMSPSANLKHQRISNRIHRIFDGYFGKGKKCEALYEFDLWINSGTYLSPDIMVVCDGSVGDDGVHGVPTIVIEILSPSTARRDRGRKKDLYEKLGVQYYIIIDPYSESIDLYVNTEEGYGDSVYRKMVVESRREDREEFHMPLRFPEFPGLEIKMEDLFTTD